MKIKSIYENDKNVDFKIEVEIESQKVFPGYICQSELVKYPYGNPVTKLEVCYSLNNGLYIGNKETAEELCNKYNIRHFEKANLSNNICSIGFNEKEQKWYGWSHRAIHGFGIGSKVKEEDCGFIPKNKRQAIKAGIRFWSGENHMNVKIGKLCERDGQKGIIISWIYSENIPNKELRSKKGEAFFAFPDVYGKGEWTAKTLEDAKQMAIDFANDVA